ncbi:MAG TPA: 2Fe-2S iron-sulfur cluster-binding protein [Woeseiaceae bacterium]|jgi:ring-1,2-phenylacetyl-CoA epoxidase subunit PaaE|nr:2Fe-2S iron-sulfur cluster-binding protein [Woeseiaceae bacterium]
MRRYHPLTIERLERESEDAVRVALAVPSELSEEFRFLPGQHLPVQAKLGGKTVRRTYSICSAPGELPLEIGVRVQPGGVFSGFVGGELAVGDRLEAMPPFGRFHANPDADAAKTYLAFAAGSGITPILSILRATLETEPASRFLLFYGNRRQRTTMFIDDLYALKNRFPERLQLFFIFSREEQEFPVFSGRLDGAKSERLYEEFCAGLEPDEAFICGPDTMIDTVREVLEARGMNPAVIHAERYGAPGARRPSVEPARPAKGADHLADVTVIMDGHRKTFEMTTDDRNIVDAAVSRGIELPYSCKAGVCATCRTFLREGEVRMETNYALEDWEVEKGFVLACQSRPLTPEVVLDYDEI